jgi:hypothetical protein
MTTRLSPSALAILLGLTVSTQASLALGPKGAVPDFGPNVPVFDPANSNNQEQLDTIFAKQKGAQFGEGRYAYLFKPGKYNLDVQVGYYMHVMGLGRSPDDVEITGAVRSKSKRSALVNFWRAAENFSVNPTLDNKINVWAVSQAAVLRRVHIKGGLNLSDQGYSSGGYLADSKVDGRVSSGSQQQWFSRNDQWDSWNGGVWNMVFVGTVNPPAGAWPTRPYTVVDKTPLIREKPYLVLDENGRYCVFVPALQSEGTKGTSWSSGTTAGTARPIDEFYIARADKDTAGSINTALSQGKSLILTPGIYHVYAPIRVTRANTIVLGLGFPTLMPDKGTAAMEVADVDGVLVSGIVFDAAPTKSPVLLKVGEPGSSASHAKNPIFLYDIWGRAGGADVGVVESMVVINSNDVVGDCFWLWRADHGKGVGWNANKNDHGLIVNGNNVTLYGLFVEHCQAYQTVWNGNGGRCYFYQSEMPYDPPSQEAWKHGNVNGYASYKIAETVTTHEAWGLGVYCVFRGSACVADNGIEAPKGEGIKMHHLVTIRLGGGQKGSGIRHVISNAGGPVITTMKATIDHYP